MTDLPPALAAHPRLSDWVELDPAGTVTLWCAKSELGQGILTALAQLVAEELDVHPRRIVVRAPTTSHGVDGGLTAGSLSVQQHGPALRQVCAEIRTELLRVARIKLGPGKVVVDDGVITHPDGAVTSYWQCLAAAELSGTATGLPPTKSPEDFRWVGAELARVDLGDKVRGVPRFVHDLKLPGQLAGRVLRPPSRAASLRSIDASTVSAWPEVLHVVVDGSFVGVVAINSEAADAALAALRGLAVWDEVDSLPDFSRLSDFLRNAPNETTVIASAAFDPDAEVLGDHNRLVSAYSRPFIAHASIGPSCAVARWDVSGYTAEVWSHTQGVHPLRRAIATALEMPSETVTVHHVEGAGSYGHNGADDAAYDAVLLARTVPGVPVQVVWSRADELTWSPLGAAMVAELSASLDDKGGIASWRHEVWSNGHTTRPNSGGTAALLGNSHQALGQPIPVAADPPLTSGGGGARNATPAYDIPRLDVVAHRLTVMPLRTSSLRSLGAHLNVFAIESFMDELAELAEVDPIEFRLRHLADPRARAVVEAAAQSSGWGSELPWPDAGRGFGYARYKGTGAWCAVVADVVAAHGVEVKRLTIAVDVGLVVNPDGVRNQIEGGAVQATSWTLTEQVRFDRRRITTDSWAEYPILSFSEAPSVEVVIVSRPEEPPVGAGEAAMGPTSAAIANAVNAALGVRVRDLPITTKAILAAMDG